MRVQNTKVTTAFWTLLFHVERRQERRREGVKEGRREVVKEGRREGVKEGRREGVKELRRMIEPRKDKGNRKEYCL